jgi:hypothetical protein
MQLLCPCCGRQNTVVDTYKPGSIYACQCGARLKYLGPDKPVQVVPKSDPLFPIVERSSKLSSDV